MYHFYMNDYSMKKNMLQWDEGGEQGLKKSKVKNLTEFRRWVKIRLVEEEISQNELAKQMGIPHARISEATHGKPTGKKHIVPIIEKLGGKLEDFEEFLKAF